MWFRNGQAASTSSSCASSSSSASSSVIPTQVTISSSSASSTSYITSNGSIFNKSTSTPSSSSTTIVFTNCVPFQNSSTVGAPSTSTSSSFTTSAATAGTSSSSSTSSSQQTPMTILTTILHKSKTNANNLLRQSNTYRSRPLYILFAVLSISLLYCLLLYNSVVQDSNLKTISSHHYPKADDQNKIPAIESPEKLIQNGRRFLQDFQFYTNKNFLIYFKNNRSVAPSNWNDDKLRNSSYVLMLRNSSNRRREALQDSVENKKKIIIKSEDFSNRKRKNVLESKTDQNTSRSHNNSGDNNRTKVFHVAASRLFEGNSGNEQYLAKLGFNIRYLIEKLIQFNQTNPNNFTEIKDILKSKSFQAIFDSNEFTNELLLEKENFSHELFDNDYETDDEDDDDDSDSSMAYDNLNDNEDHSRYHRRNHFSSDEPTISERESLKTNSKRQQKFNQHLNLILSKHNARAHQEKKIITLEDDKEFVVFLTALSTNQFEHGILLIESFRNYLLNSRQDKEVSTMVLFDLGLSEEQFTQIELLCNGTIKATRRASSSQASSSSSSFASSKRLSPSSSSSFSRPLFSSSSSSSWPSESYSSLPSFPNNLLSSKTHLRPLCLILPFNYDNYPSHITNLKSGAYRSIIIQETLRDIREHLNNPTVYNIVWLDPHYRFLSPQPTKQDNKSSLVTLLHDCRQRSGICSWSIELPTSSLTHPKLFQHFNTSVENYYFHRMITSGSIVITFNSQQWQAFEWGIMLPWLNCALDSACIEPLGSQWRMLCQSDKRPYFRFTGCHHYDMSVLNVLLGLAFKYSSRLYSLDSISSTTNSQLFLPFFKLNSSSFQINDVYGTQQSSSNELLSNLEQVSEYESFTRFDKQFTDSDLTFNDIILVKSGNS